MLPPFFFLFHRKLPPNKVPPKRKFKKALTASRPNRAAAMIITARIIIRFVIIDIFAHPFFLTFLFTRNIIIHIDNTFVSA